MLDFLTTPIWIFQVWQIPVFFLLIALIFVWRHLRNKQV